MDCDGPEGSECSYCGVGYWQDETTKECAKCAVEGCSSCDTTKGASCDSCDTGYWQDEATQACTKVI